MIEIKNLSKKFKWYDRSDSLKTLFTRSFSDKGKIWEWYVLKNLNLSIAKNERVGILGKNGSGKSSLLKIISGIYAPTEGEVKVNAERILAMIELGVGFYPQLTGRENIKLNWLFNGMPLQELENKFNEIVEFSGVEKFLDTPLKYFSSGMTARLGFSVAIHADPELLIVDEVLAVGDAEFQKKCYKKINEICDNGTTLILVSHNIEDIRNVCNRAILIENGNIACDNYPEETINFYLKSL